MKNFRKVDCVPAKKNALYLSVNVFSRKVLFGDTIFTRVRHFTWSSEAHESSCLQVKRVPSFLSYFKTLSTCPPPGIEPATSRFAVMRSTDWANRARPITIKFRIRRESSKPQTNYHWCLRFSYLAPYWVISRNTITFHKYFWCWNWKGLPRNGKMSTIGTYRFHELKLQAVSEHANKTRHYQLWDEVIFNRNWDPRWYCRRVKETQALG